ncbi:MBL fold metallo-hydrolase [Paracoccus sp. Z330]|uniref:MBL fold metallo-hydrolase n=1 Tax=Paracoccus onchidii TaxID=3017813 RepID=A0ABT4ZFL6_9RHOB|nr:MBL fold metallo-hydrolase [Paracoccus onchidii]MDB6177480.1 MBL fold metallo-hydrolase [Paracoccus onchidii]
MDIPVKEPRCILAQNPSPLTGPGTNTYLIGQKEVAVIDPGPDDPEHLNAILTATEGRVSHIFVTHAHLDHSAGAVALSRATDAPVLAFGDARAGRSALMQKLAMQGLKGNEGLDHDFSPDILLADGQIITTAEWSLQAVHTPGHSAGHLSFLWNDLLFCGDIIMAWSSTLISPPDGDLADYFRSLDKIEALGPHRLMPAHGNPIDAPSQRIAELAQHRRDRTAQILAALHGCPDTPEGIVRRIYDIPPTLLPAASRNVLAHLLALSELGAVQAAGDTLAQAKFSTL